MKYIGNLILLYYCIILFYFIILLFYILFIFYFLIILYHFFVNISSNIIFFGKRANYDILPIQYFTRNERVAFILKYANKYTNSRYFNTKIKVRFII